MSPWSSVPRRVGAAIVLWVVVVGGVRTLAWPAERCPPVDAAAIDHATREAVDWLARNQEPSGAWLYRYDRSAARVVDAPYNIVRHAGVTLSAYQALAVDAPGALATADRGLGWAEDRLIAAADGVALGEPGPVPVGASALLAAALVERREHTGETGYDDLIVDLGRFLVGQIEPDGRFLAYYDPRAGEPVPELTSPFFTGEALWALARLHTTFPDAGWDEPTRRIAAYVATERAARERQFPPISDHWAAYAYDEMARWPGGSGLTDDDRAHAHRQAGVFSIQTRFESQKHGFGPHRPIRGFEVLGAGVGTWGEGLTSLWHVAEHDGALADERDRIGDLARCVAGLLVERQVDARAAARSAEPDRTRGAWFTRDVTQMDDQQHAISALLRTLPLLEETGDHTDPTEGATP